MEKFVLKNKKGISEILLIIIITLVLAGIILLVKNLNIDTSGGDKMKAIANVSEKAAGNKNFYVKIKSEKSTKEIYVKDTLYKIEGDDIVTYGNSFTKESVTINKSEKVALKQTDVKTEIKAEDYTILSKKNEEYEYVRMEKYNGTDCYVIKWKIDNSSGMEIYDYIDKKTGFIVKHVVHNETNDIITEQEFSIGTVTSADVTAPDLSGYTINNK